MLLRKMTIKKVLASIVLAGAMTLGLADKAAGIFDYQPGNWSFNEGSGNIAYDSSGYENHGTIRGATYVDGKIGKGLYFDGVDDHVEKIASWPPKREPYQFGGTDSFSFEMWFNLSSEVPEGKIEHLFFKEGSGSNTLVYGVYIDEDEKIVGHISCDMGIYGTIDYPISTSFPADVGRWYHVAVAHTSEDAELYVNKTLVGSIDNTWHHLIPGGYHAHLLIGCKDDGWGHNIEYFNGIIDEVKIIPEPATIALLGLGGLALLRRRREKTD